MTTPLVRALAALALTVAPLTAQTTARPLPPIDSLTGVVVVDVADFASVPDVNGQAARMMHLVDELGTRRFFVNDMRGPIYSVSYDGRTVLTVPTLVIGATYDTMDPKHMEWMATQVAKCRFLLCPNGSHMAMFDDQQTYFRGLTQFLRDVDTGSFGK